MLNILFELASRSRGEAIKKIKGYSDKILEDMIKIVMYPDNQNKEHWKGKIKGNFKTISNVKTSSPLKKKDYCDSINYKGIDSPSDTYVEIMDFYYNYCDEDSPKKKRYPKFNIYNLDPQAKELFDKYEKTINRVIDLLDKNKELTDIDLDELMKIW